MYAAIESTRVDRSIRLDSLKKWELKKEKEPMPFYLHVEGQGSVVFSNANPQKVRDLLKVYNTQQLFVFVDFTAFLNGEGIDAKKVALPMADMLGYSAELYHN